MSLTTDEARRIGVAMGSGSNGRDPAVAGGEFYAALDVALYVRAERAVESAPVPDADRRGKTEIVEAAVREAQHTAADTCEACVPLPAPSPSTATELREESRRCTAKGLQRVAMACREGEPNYGKCSECHLFVAPSGGARCTFPCADVECGESGGICDGATEQHDGEHLCREHRKLADVARAGFAALSGSPRVDHAEHGVSIVGGLLSERAAQQQAAASTATGAEAGPKAGDHVTVGSTEAVLMPTGDRAQPAPAAGFEWDNDDLACAAESAYHAWTPAGSRAGACPFSPIRAVLKLAAAKWSPVLAAAVKRAEEAEAKCETALVYMRNWNRRLREALTKPTDSVDDEAANLDAAVHAACCDLAAARREAEEARADATEQARLADERLAHANGLQADLDAEQEGRMELRKRLGAREDETFGAFLARLAKQRDAARAEVETLKADLAAKDAKLCQALDARAEVEKVRALNAQLHSDVEQGDAEIERLKAWAYKVLDDAAEAGFYAECPTCAPKPGCPDLCEMCLRHRSRAGEVRRERDAALAAVERLGAMGGGEMPAIGTRWIVTPAVGSRWLDPLPTDPVQRDCEVADVLVMVRYDDLPNTPVKYTAREFANRFRPHEVREGDSLCKVCAHKLQRPCSSKDIDGDGAPCVVCGRVTGCVAEATPAPAETEKQGEDADAAVQECCRIANAVREQGKVQP